MLDLSCFLGAERLSLIGLRRIIAAVLQSSTIVTSVRVILAINGGGVFFTILRSRAAFAMMGSAHCSALMLFPETINTAVLDSLMTCRYLWQILLSGVITHHPRSPHALSQTSSSSSCLKCSSWILTLKPACRSSRASFFLPKLRSRKITASSSGFEVADCSLDFTRLQTVISREVPNTFPCGVAGTDD